MPEKHKHLAVGFDRHAALDNNMHGGNRHKNMGKLLSDAFDDMEQEEYYEEVDEWAAWSGMDEELIGILLLTRFALRPGL